MSAKKTLLRPTLVHCSSSRWMRCVQSGLGVSSTKTCEHRLRRTYLSSCLSGEADPVTPPAFADIAAVDLENALHLTGRRQGHGLAIRGCTPNIIGDFIETASVDDLDASCLERIFSMPFFIDFSGPASMIRVDGSAQVVR